ncbi:GH19209 [Drosophila grimshawi]|uniref:GH19209 n=1 Tax=Drosophila grimshawi TaxID=7222 RepID=B4JEY9_DROGR|nr:GH19209 [Drosophila grimshawi]
MIDQERDQDKDLNRERDRDRAKELAASRLSLLLKSIQPIGALHLSSLSVPRIIDVTQKAKLFCGYEMGNRTLNSVKWYKDGMEFFRYSPLTPPTTNWFPVKGVTIAEGSSHCNQFICNVELEKLNVHSSGQYRCEVSGDAPEFKLIDKAANMTVGVLPKFDPFITGIRHAYKYRDTLLANCSSEWSSPAARLTWYVNNKTAPLTSLQPQINEITRNIEGFPLYASNLQLRLHIDDQRFISKSEVLELRCSSDIMGLTHLRRTSWMRTTILALKDSGYNQRLTENGNCASARAATLGFWLVCITIFLRWHCTLS